MQRNRVILISAAAVVLALAVAILWLSSSLDERVRQALEENAADKMGVPVSVGEVQLSLFGGAMHIGNLQIGSPEGYQADHFLTADRIDAEFSLFSLLGSTFEISQLNITGVQAELENRQGRFNFQHILDRLEETSSGDSGGASSQGRMLQIDQVRMRSIRSTVSVAQPGLRLPPLQVEIPEIVLENLGSGQDNRVALAQALRQIIRSLGRQLVRQAAGASSGNWQQLLRSFTAPPDDPDRSPEVPKDLEEAIEGVKDLFKKP